MNALPEAWAAWAARKEEEPEAEWNPEGWIDERAMDERLVNLTVNILGYNIANEANEKYRVLVPPDRLRELGTRRHKRLDAAHRSRYKTGDPLVPLVVRFHAGALCRELLEHSRWSWLFLDEGTQERIQGGKGTPSDLVYLSTKTALISRVWDELMPTSMQDLRSNYYRERKYGPEDQEMLEVYRKDLLYLAEMVRE